MNYVQEFEKEYDVIVVGAGPGGYVLRQILSAAGR